MNASTRVVMTSLRMLTFACVVGWANAGAAEAWKPAANERISFDILDAGNTVGRLVLSFSRPDVDTLIVDRREDMTVSRMMIKARLEASSQERRSKDRLVRFTSRTRLDSVLKSGEASVEIARAPDETLVGRSSEGPLLLAADMLPASLWRGDELRSGAYFDAANGQPVVFTVAHAGPDEETPPGYRGPACVGRDVRMTTKGQQTRALIWVDPAGRICTMRLFLDIGPLDYVPSQAQR